MNKDYYYYYYNLNARTVATVGSVSLEPGQSDAVIYDIKSLEMKTIRNPQHFLWYKS